MEQNERDWVNDFLERHGLPTALLLLGAWYISSNVIEPMASTAKQFITDIREANVIIQDELMQIDRENLSRWDKTFDLHQKTFDIHRRNSELADRISERMDTLDTKFEQILSELEKTRMLFTEPIKMKEPPLGSSNDTPEDAGQED